jgi:hypothetical protein
LDIFKLLTLTYTRYSDGPSRDAVQVVGTELVRQDEVREEKLGVTEQILGWLWNEVKLTTSRGSSRWVFYYLYIYTII